MAETVTPHYADDWLTVYQGDARTVLAELPAESVDCVVTSPPYWGLRDYGSDGQLGLERTPEEYVANLVGVFCELRRVLKTSGTCWLSLGDSYASIGHKKSNSGYGTTGLAGGIAQEHSPLRRENNGDGLKHKDLVGIPWRVAFALQADGWWLRRDIIWAKPNPMPESVRDRPTSSHEYLFLLTKSERYFYDADAVAEPLQSGPSDLRKMAEQRDRIGGKHKLLNDPLSKASAATNIGRKRSVGPKNAAMHELHQRGGDRWNGLADAEDRSRNGEIGGRNLRSVWTIATRPYAGAHFAVFPPELPERCIKAGSPEGGVVLDPFAGSGTVGLVANKLSRRAILIDLNPAYVTQQMRRNAQVPVGL